jgi:hypothetical protein
MTDKTDLEKFCKKLKLELPDLTDNSGVTGNFGGQQVVWVDLKQKSDSLIDTIIHESVHVFQHTLEWAGSPATDKETQAYGIAYIATTLLGELSRQLDAKQLENISALHEEREARLQNREPEVQLPPGAEESSE